MKNFKDNTGREWNVEISVDSAKRLKSLLKVDITDAVTGDLVERIAGDPCLLADVLFVVCKPQAEKLGVSDEDFGRALGGDSIEAATAALLEEIVDFFPAAKRTTLRALMAKIADAEAKVLDRMQVRLADGSLDRAIDQAIEAEDARLDAILATFGA